ncbi:hypothetical protein R1flu_028899 [Riccia fluitans]|uniref:Uncharacterized protein n=1 Tax=Riccia fluitans TaxID=41844 RepID=A0ABD1XN11_9MARC
MIGGGELRARERELTVNQRLQVSDAEQQVFQSYKERQCKSGSEMADCRNMGLNSAGPNLQRSAGMFETRSTGAVRAD